MDEREKINHLDEDHFSYRATRDGKVFIYWHGKQIKALKDEIAREFLEDIEGLDGRDAQFIMATITGNFKRGNERQAKLHEEMP